MTIGVLTKEMETSHRKFMNRVAFGTFTVILLGIVITTYIWVKIPG